MLGLIVSVSLVAAQEIAEEQEPEAEPETPASEPIRLEEFFIKLRGLEVFYIPRREVELPPIEFSGTFLTDYLEPSSDLFMLSDDDKAPLKNINLRVMLAKERN